MQSVVTVLGALAIILAVIVIVPAGATVGIPSDISLPFIVLAALAFRAFKHRRGRAE